MEYKTYMKENYFGLLRWPTICGMCFSLNKPTSYLPKKEIENYIDIAMNMLLSYSAVPGTCKVYNKYLLHKRIDEWMSEQHF